MTALFRWLRTRQDFRRPLTLTDAIRTRAHELVGSGQKPLDALHLACAEAAGANWFLTCDDRLVNRYVGPFSLQTTPNFISSLSQP